MILVVGGVCSQVDGRLAGHALQIDIAIARRVSKLEEDSEVAVKSRLALKRGFARLDKAVFDEAVTATEIESVSDGPYSTPPPGEDD